MIHWKNKSLDKLSNSELQQALSEAIQDNFTRNGHSNSSDISSTFIFGVLAGASLAVMGIYASLV